MRDFATKNGRVLPETLMLPPRTVARAGAADRLLTECGPFGPRGVLVHGTSLQRSGALQRLLGEGPRRDVLPWRHPGGEPDLDQLEQLLSAARGHGANWVAAVGGGSVIDLAKAVAGLLEAPLPAQAYLDGEPIEPSRIPFIAVPTTAGTGSEATIVSVLINRAAGVKKSIRHATFIARLVILDPELLAGCPPAIVASAGMDAFTQAIESALSRHATWFSDRCAFKAARMIDRSLEAVYHDTDGAAASELLQGSYLAGLALSNARLGLVHGLAHPLGVRYHLPHGMVCAVCLPRVLNYNREAASTKIRQLSKYIGRDLFARVDELTAHLAIRSPFAGQSLDDVDRIVEEALASGSTKANPRQATAEDIRELLAKLFSAS